MAAKRTEVAVEVDGHTLTLVNLEKVMYPRTGTTKGEVLNYYAQIAPVMLPHLADRAVTRIRWPHGTGDASFFEKNVPGGTPSWVRTATVPTSGSRTRSGEDGELRFPIIDSLATLTWLVNLAALELHVHQWTVTATGRVRHPNRLVIDLDPGEPAGLGECAQVALLVRDRLAQDGLDSVPVTSGSKGLHLYAGLDGTRPHQEVRDYAKAVAEELEVGPPQAGRLADDQGPSRRQGVPRLVAEHGGEDDDLAVLAAGPGVPDGRGTTHLGGGRGRRRRPARSGAPALRGRARPGADLRGPVPPRGVTPAPQIEHPPFPRYGGRVAPAESRCPGGSSPRGSSQT